MIRSWCCIKTLGISQNSPFTIGFQARCLMALKTHFFEHVFQGIHPQKSNIETTNGHVSTESTFSRIFCGDFIGFSPFGPPGFLQGNPGAWAMHCPTGVWSHCKWWRVTMQWYAANAEGLSIWAGYLGRKKDFHWRKTCPIFFSEGLEDFVFAFFF